MKRHSVIKVIYLFLFLVPIHAFGWNGTYLGLGLECFINNHEASHVYSHYDTIKSAWEQKGFINQTQRQQYGQEMFGGYGQIFKQHVYLGGELLVRYHHYDGQYFHLFELYPDKSATVHDDYDFHSDFSLESQYSLGGILRGGYLISPYTLVYGLFGLETTRFGLSVATDVNGPVFIPSDDSHPINDKFIKWKAAWVEGVGIETMILSHLLLRTQFVYANYSKFHSKKYQNNSATSSNGVASFQLKDIDIGQYIFTVGLIYQFASLPKMSAMRRHDFNGFYVGAGVIDSHSKDRYTLNSNTGSQMLPVAYDLFHAYKGPAGGSKLGGSIFGGYGEMIGPLYGGVEFIYRKIKHHYTGIQWFELSNHQCYIADINTDYSYGLVARLGYLVNHKTLVYGIAGLERTRFDIKTNWYEDFYSKANLAFSHWHNTKTGFISGLGIETELSYGFSLRGQYTYTSYSAIQPNSYVSPSSSGMFPGDLSYQHNMYNSTVTLGVVYHI